MADPEKAPRRGVRRGTKARSSRAFPSGPAHAAGEERQHQPDRRIEQPPDQVCGSIGQRAKRSEEQRFEGRMLESRGLGSLNSELFTFACS